MAKRNQAVVERLPDFEPDEFGGNWTPRQRVFARLVLRYENLARASREAGYGVDSPEHAGKYGARLVKLPHIKAYLAAGRAESAKRMGMSAENVREELEKIAFSNSSDFYKIGEDGLPYFDLSQASHAQLAAIKGFKIEEVQENQGTREEPDYVTVRKITYDTHDKLGALNSLGRFHKMFTDRNEVVVEFGDEARILAGRERARKAREGTGK